MIEINKEYLIDALKYRSARREFVVDKIYYFATQFCKNKIYDKKGILTAIEYIHTSASIIDDMQDFEITRKSSPSYYIRHGYGNASFASLNLWTYALQILSKDYDLNGVLKYLRLLIESQETDVGLCKLSDNYNSYFQLSSNKIAFELQLIYYLSCPMEEDSLHKLDLGVIKEIGKLIQYIDDKSDEFDNFTDNLNNKENIFKLNLSLPFILADRKFFGGNSGIFFTNISKNDALAFYNKYVLNSEIKNEIENVIINQVTKIEEMLKLIPYDKVQLVELYNSVNSLTYLTKNHANESII